MTEPIEFAKLSGSGNDFVCIDARDGRYDDLLAGGGVGAFAASLCRRGRSVGADGVIFAVRPEIEGIADLAARFFEPDGSEAELCGNGTACFIHWAVNRGLVDDGEIRILTPAGVVRGHRSDGRYVRVCIPDPEEIQTGLELDVEGSRWHCDYAVTGVPHVVAYVGDLAHFDVAHWGPAIRHHDRFRPRGTNANFVEVLGTGRIALRTFEFGVEAETLACGTGSAAAAVLAALRFGWPEAYVRGGQAVEITARSGDVLKVRFTRHDDGTITDVCLDTVVRCVYDARLCPDLALRALNARDDDQH